MTPARNLGFTLLEMLVALLIFGLLCSAAVSVMVYAMDTREIVGLRMERLGEFQRARGLLKADLLQVAVRRVREPDGAPARNAFVGGSVGSAGPLLGFVRRGWENPDARPRASLQYVEYRLADGRLERSTRAALDGASPGEPRILLTGIRSATISYRYQDQWIDGWPGGARAMPQALRLDMELEGLGHVPQLFLLPGGSP